MNSTRTKITDTIINLRNHYVENYNNIDEYELELINTGKCFNIAQGVVEQLGSDTDICIIDTATVMGYAEPDYVFSYQPGLGYASRIIEDNPHILDILFGYHQWIYYEGLHYDAEHPYGVSDFMELKFFVRQVSYGVSKTG
ncbi:hypothetical protein ABGV42_00890 [Paenibacillus pabuli]|uniref:hypothetical protein n=1 Tax=Paenibacillus pabuli TaxID=1472 RepID=UPI003242AD80